jgi:hypothetical protein
MWKRPLTVPSFGFPPCRVALSPQAGRGKPGARCRADPSFWQNQIEFMNENSERANHTVLEPSNQQGWSWRTPARKAAGNPTKCDRHHIIYTPARWNPLQP